MINQIKTQMKIPVENPDKNNPVENPDANQR
jgi:hypothetical protein